ncbi:hypothetical protein GCWU000342_00569 [Shuttleworthella satelles DSM 14600]|uniref:Uncharacterized protein n=1 Tax=Shuttleworthella satelles DSM 14600 TaxID=626523 RepID=C4G9B8_9FIRM|nr:hypothetical protein GCWU000342_00569 [Shuttleworthia satelles DSM 14600]
MKERKISFKSSHFGKMSGRKPRRNMKWYCDPCQTFTSGPGTSQDGFRDD